MKPYSEHDPIVRRCLNGDRNAQYELYSLYGKGMYSICLRMLGNTHDAEDILQNSFVDVFQKLDSFRFNSSIGAWIKRIVVNNCINFLKSKKRFVFEEFLYEKETTLEKVSNISQYSVDSIKKAVQQLPEGYRAIFTLHAFEGYDHKEIGEILNISPSTSKSQYSRAKTKLKALML